MRVIRRNGKNFFPQGPTLVQLIEFLLYFQPVNSDVIYKLIGKDFDNSTVKAVDIETNTEQTFPFGRPVTKLKTF